MANSDKRSKRLWAGLVAGVILSTTLAVAAFPGSASAERRRDEHRGGRDWHHGGREYGRGYYGAPPIVYGSPYYAPPVIYGPGFGINLNIR
jgi:hypothetical protein